MKSKTPLILTELLIMLLTFVAAAGLCLRAFLWADQTSRASLQEDQAVVAAQNAAELTKHYLGDLEIAAAERGGTWDGETWIYTVDDCQVTVTLLPAEGPYLGTARVCADEIELTVSWQKEGPHE